MTFISFLFNKPVQYIPKSFGTKLRNITTHYSVKPRSTDPRWKDVDMTRSSDLFDVIIVGGGPAGLSTAIKLKQMCLSSNKSLRIGVIEKASQFGGHILSGACIDTKALSELFPEWSSMEGCPLKTSITDDKFYYLTENYKIPIFKPKFLGLSNQGCYVGRLGTLVSWLSEQAEKLGVELYPGISASEVLYSDEGAVKGIATSDLGISKNGAPKATFTRGFEFHAKVTVFGEGCRGHLTKGVLSKFKLNENSCPQKYGIGIKELWQVKPEKYQPGAVVHTIGWPLNYKTYGGSFVYHYGEDNLVGLGLVIGLNYSNPYISPYWEFQKFKTHPYFKNLLEGGQRIGYGARVISEGGFQAIPKLAFPGGCLIGDAAGFLNVPKIKGIHTAMKSGLLAAEAIYESLSVSQPNTMGVFPQKYEELFKKSWVFDELKKVRNVKPSSDGKLGLYFLLPYTGLSLGIFKGKEPWTFKWTKKDNEYMEKASVSKKIIYPKPDGKLTFDLMSSVALTGTDHESDQPPHLTLLDDNVPVDINLKEYGGPEHFYCPAGVYVFNQSADGKYSLQINAQNCIHCKTCDIKDPTQNIQWVVPENGGGPAYNGM